MFRYDFNPTALLFIFSLRTALTSLEEARATVLAQQQSGPKGRSKELDQLMAADKKGGPLQNAGLRGRLGDLGTIDPEFDIAIRFVILFVLSYDSKLSGLRLFRTIISSSSV